MLKTPLGTGFLTERIHNPEPVFNNLSILHIFCIKNRVMKWGQIFANDILGYLVSLNLILWIGIGTRLRGSALES
jgi:hypothetical protein